MCFSGLRLPVLLSVIALSLLECSLVSAITRADFYPLGNNTLPNIDDLTRESVLDPPFHFFGKPYSHIFVSTTYSTYTGPRCVDFLTSCPDVDQYKWADICGRGSDRIYSQTLPNFWYPYSSILEWCGHSTWNFWSWYHHLRHKHGEQCTNHGSNTDQESFSCTQHLHTHLSLHHHLGWCDVLSWGCQDW